MLALFLLAALLPAHGQVVSSLTACEYASATLATNAFVYGRITDPTGALIPSAEVGLESGGRFVYFTSSDTSGCIHFTPRAGHYTLHARSQGFAEKSAALDLLDGKVEERGIALALGRGCNECVEVADDSKKRIFGQMVDAGGIPIANAKVTLLRRHLLTTEKIESARTSLWGDFTFDVPSNEYALHAVARGFESYRAKILVRGITLLGRIIMKRS